MTDESRAASPIPIQTRTTSSAAARVGPIPATAPGPGVSTVIGSRIRKRKRTITTTTQRPTRNVEYSTLLSTIQRLEEKLERQDRQAEAIARDVAAIRTGLHREFARPTPAGNLDKDMPPVYTRRAIDLFREDVTGQLHTIMTTFTSTVGEVSVMAEHSKQLQQETEKKIEEAARGQLAQGEIARIEKEAAEAARRMGVGEGEDMDWADESMAQDVEAEAALQDQCHGRPHAPAPAPTPNPAPVPVPTAAPAQINRGERRKKKATQPTTDPPIATTPGEPPAGLAPPATPESTRAGHTRPPPPAVPRATRPVTQRAPSPPRPRPRGGIS